jgi:hypothetical protein
MLPIFSDKQRETFVRNYNRESFLFEHTLNQNPLFDLDQIIALARRLPPSSYYYSTTAAKVGDGWEEGSERKRSLVETLETIASTNSLVILKHVERDPEYGPVFENALKSVVDQVGDKLRDDLVIGRATLLVSSPKRVTAYHIDGETNYLLQLRGTKDFSVFDGFDRTILTPEELESFYSGNLNGAIYKPELQSRAKVYPLAPGNGAHVPLHCPHWVQNSDAISVSLSLNFNLRSGERLQQLHQINHKLRQRGFHPAMPGDSAMQDQLKLMLHKGLRTARAAIPHRQ